MEIKSFGMTFISALDVLTADLITVKNLADWRTNFFWLMERVAVKINPNFRQKTMTYAKTIQVLAEKLLLAGRPAAPPILEPEEKHDFLNSRKPIIEVLAAFSLLHRTVNQLLPPDEGIELNRLLARFKSEPLYQDIEAGEKYRPNLQEKDDQAIAFLGSTGCFSQTRVICPACGLVSDGLWVAGLPVIGAHASPQSGLRCGGIDRPSIFYSGQTAESAKVVNQPS